jgi:mannan endo-1,4-beta-mannosidase
MIQEFVKTEGIQFKLAGNPFPVSGVNCYFLGYCSDPVRRSVMTAAAALGANVIRMWAFLDAETKPAGGVAFQYLDGGRIVQDTGPMGLERLDALIAAAEEADLRLILPLVNYWKDFGGMPQYLRWLGIPGGQDAFYREPVARAAYRTWVQTILTRRNTRTNRTYLDEPAVMAWELANEPRCEVAGGRELLLDWIGEMSAFVKSLDRNHLLALGDEGFLRHAHVHDHLYDGSHGVDGEATLNFGEIDFGTYHFYPDAMQHAPEFGETWIRDHVASGQRANKPMLLEEYGLALNTSAAPTPADRKTWYSRWIHSVFEAGGGGDLLWMLGNSDPETAGFRDDFTIYSAVEAPPLGAHREEAVAREQPPETELEDDEAAVQLVLTNVEGDPVNFEANDISMLRAGNQVPFEMDDGSGALVVSAGVREAWAVQFSPPRYLPRSSEFFFLNPGDSRTIAATAVRDRDAWSPSFLAWNDLAAAFQPLKDLLSVAGDVALLPSNQNLGNLAGDAYDRLSAEALPKTALLNLFYKLRSLPDPIHKEKTWFSYARRILMIGRERLIAVADPAIADSVKQVLQDPARYGYHAAEDPDLHRQFLPPAYQSIAGTKISSIKASIREASLQVTVSEIPQPGPQGTITLLDADLDEHGDLLEHIFDGLIHILTRGTHPYDIHEFLVAQATGQGVKVNLGYTLV